MKKQAKKAVSGRETRQQLNRGKGIPAVSVFGDKEMDTDELVHENRDEEPAENEEFDSDEVIHKTHGKPGTRPGKEEDIDDLVHKNSNEDDQPIF